MNKKNSDGWILCPSKSYPGKFYYFNVINGEAAWCLTEAEKKTLLKESPIKKVSDKTHTYPEPNTPPVEESLNMSNVCYNFSAPTNIPLSFVPTPQIFGQPVFPKYFPNEYLPNYVLPVPPMFVANKPEKKKRVFDQITQTSEPDRDVFVQSSTIPLSDRFGTYPKAAIDTNAKISINKSISSSTSHKVNWWRTDCQKKYNFDIAQGSFDQKPNHNKFEKSPFKPVFDLKLHNENKIKKSNIIKEPVLKTLKRSEITIPNKDNTGSYKMFKPIEKSAFVKESKIETGDRCPDYGGPVQNIVFDNCFKKRVIQNTKPKTESNNSKSNFIAMHSTRHLNSEAIEKTFDKMNYSPKNLNNNDLRFVLEAKRRKSNPNNDSPKLDEDETMPNINNDNKVRIEKNVTFNPRMPKGEEEIDSIEESEIQEAADENKDNSSQVLNITYLKNLSGPYLKTDPWYVVVDMGVLLDDFEFIDDLVKKDITCRLLVPNSVCAYIKTISVGEYAGRNRVMLARKAIRRLAAPGQHVILQPPVIEKHSPSAIEAIIECCLQILQQHHAILITTDIELYNRGVSSDIHTYKLGDIKRSLAEAPEVSFYIKKTDVKVNNDNIFTQHSKDFGPCHDNLNTNGSNVFKVPTAIVKDKEDINQKKALINASTSPIHFDKLIDVTRTRRFLNNMKLNKKPVKDPTETESDIEESIKNLHLQDNTKAIVGIPNGAPHSHSDFNCGKSIVNTNYDKYNIKEYYQSFQSTQSKHVNQKVILNPINDLRKYDVDKVTSTSEFKTKYLPQSINSTNVKAQITKEGNRLEINVCTIDEILKRFNVKDAVMSRRVSRRLNEWICCFTQIMEEVLNDILMMNSSCIRDNLTAPWTLQEAIHCMKNVYSNETAVKTVTEKMSDILSYLTSKNGNLNRTMKPVDFMKLFGCGVLLVESLKTVFPKSEQVKDSEELLKILQHNMEDPTTDTDLPLNHTPIRRSDTDDTGCLNRNIGPKKPSEIIKYLKAHYPTWREYNGEILGDIHIQKEKIQHQNATVIRTFGKNLNTINIENSKQITFGNAVMKKLNKLRENIDENEKKAKISKVVESEQNDIENNLSNNNNYFGNTEKCVRNTVSFTDEKGRTEVIRHFNVISDFENNIHKKAPVDMDALDYSENDYVSTKSTENSSIAHTLKHEETNAIEFANFNDNFADHIINENDDNIVLITDEETGDLEARKSIFDIEYNDKKTRDDNEKFKNDSGNFNDNSNNDSGFENESLYTCSFIRTFLTELSASFRIIYNFVDESIQEFRCDDLRHGTRKTLYDRANETHLHVADIIGKLKRIIEREASDKTKLKCLIINAGVEALTDKRMTRYRQVITKCLEQAQLLEGALKIMLALTNEHCDITAVDVDRNYCDIRYFNIFE